MNASNNITPAPPGRDVFHGSPRPTVLYQGADVLVTTAFFEFGGNRFPLRQLDDIERVEHGSWLQSKMYELWARFQDQRVRLFQGYDAQEFGQVCRALTRAREHAGLA